MLRRILICTVISLIALVNVNAQSDVTLDDLDAIISEMNKEMPQYVSEELNIASFALNKTDKVLIFYFQIKPGSGVTASALDQYKDVMTSEFVNTSKEDADMKFLFDVLKKYGYGVRLIFTDNSGDKCVMNHPASKL